MLIPTTLIIYMLVLLALSRLTARKSSNSTFFTGERRSPWYMVAFGMVGASISGVSVVPPSTPTSAFASETIP